MKHFLGLIVVLMLATLLSGCGGDDKKNDENDAADAPTEGIQITVTPRAPAPRSRTLPSEDPHQFEAPLSVGNYVRESMSGQPTGMQTGGLQAIYSGGSGDTVLTVYYFRTPAQAVESVRFALESSSIVEQLDKPFYDPVVAYGVARDRHGAYVAAWSHYEWFFQVRTTGDLEMLNTFMETFPY